MRALERLTAIMQSVASSSQPVAPTAVATSTGLSLSTVARLMQQMAEASLLSRDVRTGTYTLGPQIFAIAHAGMHQYGLRAHARPLLEELRDASGETASLHVRAGSRRICVDMAPSNHSVARLVTVGSAHSLFGSASGDALLAGAPAAERARLLAALAASDREAVDADIARTRESGYSMSVNRWAQGVVSIAAPVDKGGAAIGALSVSGPSDRFTPERARDFSVHLMEAAVRLTHLI